MAADISVIKVTFISQCWQYWYGSGSKRSDYYRARLRTCWWHLFRQIATNLTETKNKRRCLKWFPAKISISKWWQCDHLQQQQNSTKARIVRVDELISLTHSKLIQLHFSLASLPTENLTSILTGGLIASFTRNVMLDCVSFIFFYMFEFVIFSFFIFRCFWSIHLIHLALTNRIVAIAFKNRLLMFAFRFIHFDIFVCACIMESSKGLQLNWNEIFFHRFVFLFFCLFY